MMRQYELVERVHNYKPDVNEALLNKAYVYAMQKHGKQTRANGAPYISHPLEVAAILTDMRMDEATVAVALLHDTIEDTSATRDEIDELFGEEIGGLVEGLTKIRKLDLVSKRAKQAENLRKLLLAISDDVRVAAGQACRPVAQHAYHLVSFRRKSGRGLPKRRWTSMRRLPAAWACRTCAKSWKNLLSSTSTPKRMKPSPTG